MQVYQNSRCSQETNEPIMSHNRKTPTRLTAAPVMIMMNWVAVMVVVTVIQVSYLDPAIWY